MSYRTIEGLYLAAFPVHESQFLCIILNINHQRPKHGGARTRNEDRLYLRFPLFENLRIRHEPPLWWLNDLTISESCPG